MFLQHSAMQRRGLPGHSPQDFGHQPPAVCMAFFIFRKMKQETLSIKTVPVTIRVIEVSGKKMTLSVFNQIQYDFFPWDIYRHFDTNEIFIGWVQHKDDKYILFQINGQLLKEKFEFNTLSPESNKKYFDLFTGESQIYIAI